MIDASKTRWLDMMGMAVSDPDHQDVHEAFRGAFRSTAGTRARIDVFSTCPFLIYLDGALIGEGPMRWADTQPEYQSFEVKLKTGDHVSLFTLITRESRHGYSEFSRDFWHAGLSKANPSKPLSGNPLH